MKAMPILVTVFALISLSVCPADNSQDITLLKVTLGKSLNEAGIKECTYETFGNMKVYKDRYDEPWRTDKALWGPKNNIWFLGISNCLNIPTYNNVFLTTYNISPFSSKGGFPLENALNKPVMRIAIV